MKWIVRISLWFGLFVALLIGAALIFEPEFDLGVQRERVARLLTSVSGREVSLAGTLHLKLGRHVRLQVGDVSVANPDWAEQPNLLTVGEADVGVDLASMLLGTWQLEGVRLRDAQIALQVSPEGQRTWVFGEESDGMPRSPDAAKSGTRGMGLRLAVATLEKVTLIYQTPQTHHRLQLSQFSQRDDEGSLVLDGSGKLDGLALHLAGRVGTLDALERGKDIGLDLEMSLAEAQLLARGRLGDLERLAHIDLEASLHAPDLARILNPLGIAYPQPDPVNVNLTVRDKDPGLSWDVKGSFGSLQLDIQGSLREPARLDGLGAKADVHGKDLALLAPLLGLPSLPAQPYRIEGRISREGGRFELRGVRVQSAGDRAELEALLPAFPTLDGAHARLLVNVTEPSGYARVVKDLALNGPLQIQANLTTLADGGTGIDAKGSWGTHSMNMDGRIGHYPAFQDSDIRLRLAGPSLPVPTLAQAKPLAYRLAGRLSVDKQRRLVLDLDEGVIGDLKLSASGSLGNLPDLDDTDLAISAEGSSLRGIAERFTPTVLPDLPYSLNARLRGRIAEPTLVDTGAGLGKATLATKGELRLSPGFSGSDLQIKLGIPDLAAVMPGTPPEGWGHASYQASGRVRSAEGRLHFDDVGITGGGLEASLSGSLLDDLSLNGANLRLTSNTRDLAKLLPPSPSYRPPQAPLRLNLELSSRDKQLEVRALQLDLADASLTGKGAFSAGKQGMEGTLSVLVKVPRLSALGSIDGITLPEQPLQLKAKVEQNGVETSVEDLALTLAGGEVSGRLSYTQQPRSYIDMNLVAKGVDLRRLQKAAASKAPVASQKPLKSTDRLFTNSPAAVPALEKFDGRLRFRGENLFVPDPKFAGKAILRKLSIDANLSHGRLTIDDLLLDGDRGALHGKGTLIQAAEQVETEWQLKGNKIHFGFLSTGEGLDKLPEHELEAVITTRGKTYRDLAAKMNGKIQVTGGSGLTNNTGLDKAMGSFLNELITSLNPFHKEEKQTRIDCSAAKLSIDDGIIQMQPGLVIRSDKIDIAANGSVDLRNEKIDVQFRSTPRKGLGISAAGLVQPFIKVGGTLSQPGIDLDRTQALVSGTAAIATGGLSILAVNLLDRVSATTTNPCEAVIRKADGDKAPAKLNPLDAISNAIRGKPGSTKPQPPKDKSGSVLDLIH